jgi:predicted acylesterase/phospholipase RssA
MSPLPKDWPRRLVRELRAWRLRKPRQRGGFVQRFIIGPVVWILSVSFVLFLLGLFSRNYTGLGTYYKPVGREFTGGLDLDNPVPFTRLQLDNPVIGLSCSGGGSRAAYFTAAILSEIQRGVKRISEPRPDLLSRLSAISSVSGGSLAAAYFALHRKALLSGTADSPDWQEYRNKMAESYRRREWSPRALIPTVGLKLLFTNYNRGLLARDDYDKTLFGRATINDLPSQPALYINSFDVANHVRFVFSKTYINTTYYLPPGWWGDLSAPQELTTENDLGFCRVDPASVTVADAVYASSAFPVAYPNLALNHFGNKVLFQGRLIFLADGGLADNSGLVTLLTQIRAALETAGKERLILVIHVDSTTSRIDANGSRFQQLGVEGKYAWHDTIIGHGIQSIDAGNSLLQDLTWKFLESNGVVTDQLNVNWPIKLKAKSENNPKNPKTSFDDLFDRGELAFRPCVIRLGLRDVANPNFPTKYLNTQDPRLEELLRANGIKQIGPYQPAVGLAQHLQRIPTDFALSDADRRALDLAAYLLVNGKLADDLGLWARVTDGLR